MCRRTAGAVAAAGEGAGVVEQHHVRRRRLLQHRSWSDARLTPRVQRDVAAGAMAPRQFELATGITAGRAGPRGRWCHTGLGASGGVAPVGVARRIAQGFLEAARVSLETDRPAFRTAPFLVSESKLSPDHLDVVMRWPAPGCAWCGLLLRPIRLSAPHVVAEDVWTISVGGGSRRRKRSSGVRRCRRGQRRRMALASEAAERWLLEVVQRLMGRRRHRGECRLVITPYRRGVRIHTFHPQPGL